MKKLTIVRKFNSNIFLRCMKLNQTRDDAGIIFLLEGCLTTGRILNISKKGNDVLLDIEQFRFIQTNLNFPLHFKTVVRTNEVVSIQVSQIQSKIFLVPFGDLFLQISHPLQCDE